MLMAHTTQSAKLSVEPTSLDCALGTNPQTEMVQDHLKKVYKHYCYPPKDLCELRDIADSMKENICGAQASHQGCN